MKTTFPEELNIITVYSLSSSSYQNIFTYRMIVLGLQSLQHKKNLAQSAGKLTKEYNHFLVFEQ